MGEVKGSVRCVVGLGYGQMKKHLKCGLVCGVVGVVVLACCVMAADYHEGWFWDFIGRFLLWPAGTLTNGIGLNNITTGHVVLIIGCSLGYFFILGYVAGFIASLLMGLTGSSKGLE